MKDQQEEAQASSPRTISWISVQSLKEILESKSDFILLDIQEEGDFANGHIFHSIHLPYSRLELNVGRLVPNRCTRIILTSSGDDGVPNLAFRRLSALGYTHVEILQGGNEAWLKAGNAIFQGVHVPS